MKRFVIALVAPLLLAACGGHSSPTAVHQAHAPAEFQHACGHPGSTVEVAKVPVTVQHAACDLTGVVLRYQGSTATVPGKNQAVAFNQDGPTASRSLTVSVDSDGNVTVST